MKSVLFVVAFAVVASCLCGCGASLRPDLDGQIAGFIPVSSLESPINAIGSAYGVPAAGTSLVRADGALVQRRNPSVKPYPTLSVSTQFLDSVGSDVKPFFDADGNPYLDMVETPVYGPRTTRLSLGPVSAPPIVVDQDMIQKALQLYNEAAKASASGVPVVLPSVSGTQVQQLPVDVPAGFEAIREQ